MKRATAAMLLALALAVGFAFAGSSTTIVHRRTSTPPANCTAGKAITFWWRAEDINLDATLDHTAGDNSASPNGVEISIGSGGAKLGSSGIVTADADDYYTFSVTSGDIINGDSGTIAFWWRFPGTINLGHIVQVREGSSDLLRIVPSSNSRIDVVWVEGGTIEGTVSGSNSSISANNWYFVHVTYDASQGAGADSIVLDVYDSGGSFISAASASNTAMTLDPIAPSVARFGSTGGSQPTHLDHIIMSTTLADDLSECLNQANYDGS